MRWLKQWRFSQIYDTISPKLSALSYCSGASGREESSITREWLLRLWREEEKRLALNRQERVRANDRNVLIGHNEVPLSGAKQPPITQFGGKFLSPSSSVEARLAPLLARANLLITREIEWANIMFSFEQENRYALVDACYPESPVGHIREQSNIIFRQLLRSRRPFIAHITDAKDNEIFRVRRPFWLINSTIYAEVDGTEVGVVHRRWHLWRRIYDLYVGNKQFAVVENPGFWNWTFTLKNEDDKVLAQIDRNWRGIGFELFTDAGRYVIQFGDTDSSPKTGLASAIQDLEVARSLTMSERAVTLALAVSLDNDYFSNTGRWGMPLFIAAE